MPSVQWHLRKMLFIVLLYNALPAFLLTCSAFVNLRFSHCRFIIGLHYAMQDRDYVYLILELLSGGAVEFTLVGGLLASLCTWPKLSIHQGTCSFIFHKKNRSRKTWPDISSHQLSWALRHYTILAGCEFLSRHPRFWSRLLPWLNMHPCIRTVPSIQLGVLPLFLTMPSSPHIYAFSYRDLKPENILLSAKGYCKITDLGNNTYFRSNQIWRSEM